MLLRQYRLMQHVKIMQYEKLSRQELVKNLGIAPFAAERTMRQAQGYTGAQVRRGVEICLDTEYKVKAGQRGRRAGNGGAGALGAAWVSVENRVVDEEIALIPYYPNPEAALPWYRECDVCKWVDNIDKLCSLEWLNAMYTCLSTRGA